MGRNKSTEWLDVIVKVTTNKAVLLSNGKNEAWVARSQIVDSEGALVAGVETRVELPVWLLEDSGLV